MRYVFDPDNWEWLFYGNNARFIVEGLLVNLEIAVISMVLSLIVGLALALDDLLKTARTIGSRGFEYSEAFLWAAVGYLTLTGLATLAIRFLEKRYAIHR